MFKFLYEQQGASTMRVCMFLLTLAVCFHISWATVTKADIHWLEISALLAVVLYGKIRQKRIEVENE